MIEFFPRKVCENARFISNPHGAKNRAERRFLRSKRCRLLNNKDTQKALEAFRKAA